MNIVHLLLELLFAVLVHVGSEDFAEFSQDGLLAPDAGGFALADHGGVTHGVFPYIYRVYRPGPHPPPFVSGAA
jgi:hypothetical protein